jgi:hypothetical protein
MNMNEMDQLLELWMQTNPSVRGRTIDGVLSVDVISDQPHVCIDINGTVLGMNGLDLCLTLTRALMNYTTSFR